MKLLSLKNISKSYELSKGNLFYALKNINLVFSDVGFNSIVGKSGSGKSTLLNIITQIDSPSSGEIYLNRRRYDNKKKKLYNFYRHEIGIVFQNFNLLEDQTSLYNVALPLLISGVKKKKAYKKAKEILAFVNISESIFNLKTSKLSGGEKQRVAIARALINNPKILICDEPTGSLDSSNSKVVMELLKRISKTRLVIMVSHNLQLVKEYSDRIIELEDGKIINDYRVNKIESIVSQAAKPPKGRSNWTSSFTLSNYKKRFKRNAFVVLALSICMVMANLVVGFINGKDQAILNACFEQLDFGSGTISEDEVVSNTGILKLTKQVRPDFEKLVQDPKISQYYEICPNFSAICPQNPQILYDEVLIENTTYEPIYSFTDDYVNPNLLIKGSYPQNDTLNAILINEKCYKYLKRIINKDPLFEPLDISYHIETSYVLENGEYISDTFDYQISSFITGVVKELDYLSSSKIYYSHLALESYLQEYSLINLSTYLDSKYTWYDRVMLSENHSFITSYSYRLFLKDYHLREDVFKKHIFDSKYSFTSGSLIIARSLIDFLEVAKYALLLFLGITSIGSVLILSIISLTNYAEDRKTSAILTALGARQNEIENIYLNESLISGLIALGVSTTLSFPLSLLANKVIFNLSEISNMIKIPLKSFLGIPFFYPFILITLVFLLVSLSTLIPIKFSKSHSIRMELQSND